MKKGGNFYMDVVYIVRMKIPAAFDSALHQAANVTVLDFIHT
jgi:hypothetical protein